MDARAASLSRSDNLASLREPFDVAIIGGGIVGSCAARELAARGHRVALLEAEDFASGASGASSAINHRGLRYVMLGEFAMLRRAAASHALWFQVAPHLVHPAAFILPRYHGWERLPHRAVVKTYERLAGPHGIGRHHVLSREQVLERMPNLRAEGLRGGIEYLDGLLEDARLNLAVARTAAALGATVLNHARVVAILKDGSGRVNGLRVVDTESGTEHVVRARAVLNATGAAADAVRRLDRPDGAPTLAPSKGIHLVFPERAFPLPSQHALVFPRGIRRVLFILPRQGRVVVGTTERPVTDPLAPPRAEADERAELRDQLRRCVREMPDLRDAVSQMAGYRPLRGADGSSASHTLSRDHGVHVDPSGLVTMTGGKYTTAPEMGRDAAAVLTEVAGLGRHPDELLAAPLFGAPSEATVRPRPGHREEALALHGSEAPGLRALEQQRPELAMPLHPRLPYSRAQVVWAARHEAAVTLEDVLARRLRATVLDARAANECAADAVRLLARERGKPLEWEQDQLAQFIRHTQDAFIP